MMCAKKADGRAKMLECEDTGELKILPVLVDADGAVITTST
jgi:hypothetical protein